MNAWFGESKREKGEHTPEDLARASHLLGGSPSPTVGTTVDSGEEHGVQSGLQAILDGIAPGRFECVERKSFGSSAIGKPVDLQIQTKIEGRTVLIAVEVANVNTTQLVGETCRLYYDHIPLKLLILGERNVPSNGQAQCEQLLARLYGQDDIRHTPARVAWYHDDDTIERALRELLML